MQGMTDQMIVIVADVVEVDVTVIEMVEEIEDVTDPEVVAGDVIDPGVETGDGIVTGVMTGEGETGVTPEIIGGVVTALRDQMTKNWNLQEM